MFASIGEYEPFSFPLRPKENLEKAMIAATKLKSPAGAIPTANAASASVEEFHEVGRRMLMPLGEPWTRTPGSPLTIWAGPIPKRLPRWGT